MHVLETAAKVGVIALLHKYKLIYFAYFALFAMTGNSIKEFKTSTVLVTLQFLRQFHEKKKELISQFLVVFWLLTRFHYLSYECC